MKDVFRYVQNNGNELLDMFKSFLVFTQGTDANASFWSEFFGGREVQERSFSYAERKSWNPFKHMWDTGGVVDTPRKYKSSSMNVQKVKKPIYPPEVFRELRAKEVMCYLKSPLLRRKTPIE